MRPPALALVVVHPSVEHQEHIMGITIIIMVAEVIVIVDVIALSAVEAEAAEEA